MINSTTSSDDYHQPRLLPYSTLPASSTRGTCGYYSNKNPLSASSEPNIIDLTIIDRITKYGEIAPNSRKLNDEEILRQPIVRNLDNGKYIPLSDANPITQTILERVHGTSSVIALRQNSIFTSNINLRKNSLDTNNLSKSELNLSRQKHQHNHDDNQSTSSGSSSTKSSPTTVLSSSSVTSTSSTTVRHAAPSIKKQLTKLMVRNFLRRRKNKTNSDHHETVDIDDEEDDNERLLINDGSNGDLKYKASRYLKEPTQFDKTQLLQTIVNAHNGPIWCMRYFEKFF